MIHQNNVRTAFGTELLNNKLCMSAWWAPDMKPTSLYSPEDLTLITETWNLVSFSLLCFVKCIM